MRNPQKCESERPWYGDKKRYVKTIGKHINNAVREELSDQVVVAKFATNLHRKAQFFVVWAFLYIE